MENEAGEGVPSYLQPDAEPDLDELNLPSAPSGHTAVPANRHTGQVNSSLDQINLNTSMQF